MPVLHVPQISIIWFQWWELSLCLYNETRQDCQAFYIHVPLYFNKPSSTRLMVTLASQVNVSTLYITSGNAETTHELIPESLWNHICRRVKRNDRQRDRNRNHVKSKKKMRNSGREIRRDRSSMLSMKFTWAWGNFLVIKYLSKFGLSFIFHPSFRF